MNLINILSDYLLTLDLKPESESLNKLVRFLDLIYDQNKRFNLVGTTDRVQIFIRHILDCLSIFSYLREAGTIKKSKFKIIDVGSGAGLPGIIIGIVYKETEVTLLDSRKKVIEFLKHVVDVLAIKNVRIICGRSEEISHLNDYREVFDIAVARAVARVNILCELTVPFCRIGGKIIMYKGRKVQEELDEACKAIGIMGAHLEGIFEVNIPLLDEYRALLVLNKSASTMYKYPRKYAKIIKKPVI